MNISNDLHHLILNSINHFYIFQIDREKILSYKTYDFNYDLIEESIITEDKVLNFSVALDDNNRINLVYLLNTGELYHKILYDSQWVGSVIGKYNTKSNRYNELKVLFIQNKLNIFYSYSNLINSNIYTIQHIVYGSSVEEQYNVVKYISTKFGDPFVVDVDDSGTIHLLYNTITNKSSYIYHCFYSPYRKSWSVNPKELSKTNGSNIKPYIFIDSKSDIHALWLEENSQQYNLKYNIMHTKGKNKFNWNPVEIPYDFSNTDLPLILEINNIINIFYNDGHKNYLLFQKNSSSPWIKKELSEGKDLITLSISKNIYPDIKGNHILGNLDDKASIYLLNNINYQESHEKQEDSSLSLDQESLENLMEENQNDKIPQDPSPSKEELFFQEIEQLKAEQENLKSLINQILFKEKEMRIDIDSLKYAFKEEPSSFLERLFTKY